MFPFMISVVFCRYHPVCVDLTIEQAKQLDRFVCSCPEEDVKKPHKTPPTNGKVMLEVLFLFVKIALLYVILSCFIILITRMAHYI